jgi:hypothetical protein
MAFGGPCGLCICDQDLFETAQLLCRGAGSISIPDNRFTP